MLGGNLRWTIILTRGSSDAPSRLILRKTDLSTGSITYSGSDSIEPNPGLTLTKFQLVINTSGLILEY